MPAPQASLLAQQTKTLFAAKQKELQEGYEEPTDQFDDAFAITEQIAIPNAPTNLLREVSLNKYHVDSAKEISDKLEAYIDGVSKGICGGIDNWMKMTMITTVIINGPVGMLTPGGVVGPPLGPLILAGAPMATPMEIKYTNAIANAFGTAWQSWSAGLMGQLMYPAFAAFPGPMAPPMPNVPVPLITLSSPGESMLSPSTLAKAMEANLGDPEAAHAEILFECLAKAFGTVFQTFKASTMVTGVMGTGPVPTFVPPFVPVGPVVMGSVIPKPGIFV